MGCVDAATKQHGITVQIHCYLIANDVTGKEILLFGEVAVLNILWNYITTLLFTTYLLLAVILIAMT